MRWILAHTFRNFIISLAFIIALPWLLLEFIICSIDALMQYVRWWDYLKLYERFVIALYRVFGFKAVDLVIGSHHFKGTEQLHFIILNNKIKCIVFDNHRRNEKDLYFVKIITSKISDINLIKILFDDSNSTDSTIW